MRDRGVEAVMHFAALASVPESVADPERTIASTWAGPRACWTRCGPPGSAGSSSAARAATYGFHAEMPLREDSPQLPETPYGKTKLACEWLIQDYARAYGLGYAVLRYFNAAGADPGGDFGEDRRHEGHLIPLVLQAAVGRRPKVMIYGNDYPTRDGTCERDYIHTADLAQAHQLAVEAIEPGEGPGVQRRHGDRRHGPRGAAGLRGGGRPADPARVRRPTARRPGRADRLGRPAPERAGLVAPLPRHPRHRPDRLGLASPPPRRLRPPPARTPAPPTDARP